MDKDHSRTIWFPVWLRWLLWMVFALGWTAALLLPHPPHPESLDSFPYGNFLAAKCLHISAYAAWTVLTVSMRQCRWLLALVLFHGVATEFLQSFIPSRTGSVSDVALDWFGVGLGLLLGWRWWR